MKKIFTIKEYNPSYQGLESYYITYNLQDKTINVNGRIKPMNKFLEKKALAYIEKIK